MSADRSPNATRTPATDRIPGAAPLLAARRFLTRETVGDHGRTLHQIDGSHWESFYRDRWRYDRVVRSTHGVNCTGSCSWNVFVKDGLITWEHQATDYPTTGPDAPDYEPRGCPRGASFSWYEYSPSRVRHPYVRGVLAEMFREAVQRLGDPVLAWADIVENPVKARAYKAQRGRGGFVRATWDEAITMTAAAHVYTTKKYGPDRVVGFSPIPAMSMASFAAGTRYHALLGGTLLSFYDWYADLPIASPQIWGDQTDVPEAGDWWNATYLMMWGSNVPVTRTPDAHFMAEARYKGTKVVAVSPDYADNVKFADDWLAPHPGTDGALAMAMGHVVLNEFFRERQVPYFTDYVRRYTDLPFLVTLRSTGEDLWAADRFLTAADLGQRDGEHKTVLLDERTGELVVPNGSLGFRYADDGEGRWNLDLGEVVPALGLLERTGDAATVELARFDAGDTEGGAVMRRGVPVMRVGEHLVTSVFDLLMAQYGVRRGDLPGDWPTGYDDPDAPNTPAWQERITGVPAALAARIGREFARNAERSAGRSMIVLGAGANQWFHSDMTYRAFITLVTLTGCQGVNGGGWAHYVGQEKARPVTGQQHLSFAFDWQRPMRHQAATPFWYLHTDQWRYERVPADELSSPLGTGRFAGMSFADTVAAAQRMGWSPGHPFFNRNPLDLCDEAAAAGRPVAEHIVAALRDGTLRTVAEDPDDPANFPRCLTLWRCNLLGSSGKGNEYFMRHLLGADSSASAAECEPGQRPRDMAWRDEAPVGKLDLLTAIDFRMTNTGLHADLVLPAATWYEKHDISTTDMHPFVHAFSPAVEPPSDAHTDYDTFLALADKVSELAVEHLGVRRDVLAAPLQHDTPDELATPGGRVRDWRFGECEPVPGRTMPKLVELERDYTLIGRKMRTVGPLLDTLGTTTKAVTVDVTPEIEYLRRRNGVIDGRPSLETADRMCEAILALSGTTNGRVAHAGFAALEKRTGRPFTDLIEGHEGDRITYAQTQDAPQPVFTSPEWSGSEKGGRRYSPFTLNVERSKPWHTLTGRQHFFVEHDWVAELGEQLPAYRPPLNMARHFGPPGGADDGGVTVRFLTPHAKWSIHSMYHDNELMLAPPPPRDRQVRRAVRRAGRTRPRRRRPGGPGRRARRVPGGRRGRHRAAQHPAQPAAGPVVIAVSPADRALVFELASLMLTYPDDELLGAGDELRAAAAGVQHPAARGLLAEFAGWLLATPVIDAQREYVQTFDLRRRSGLYLTYYLHGDTRRRGMALLVLKQRYRAHGLRLADGELPDLLPVVLEFAAVAGPGDGEAPLRQHRQGLELLRAALTEAGTPYRLLLDAVCSVLPGLTDGDRAAIAALAVDGPPVEAVGLDSIGAGPDLHLAPYPACSAEASR